MALLVTLFLVLVNIFNTVTTNTPKAEGLTAIEAWMLSCILFVFASLVEYAGLLFSKDQFETPIEVEPPANPPEQDWIETDPCRSVFCYFHYKFVSNTGLPTVFAYLQSKLVVFPLITVLLLQIATIPKVATTEWS